MITYILCIHFYRYDHKCMLTWFKMIKMIIFMFKRKYLIFHILTKISVNLMILIYQENDLVRDTMNLKFISNLKYIYLDKNIFECMINRV